MKTKNTNHKVMEAVIEERNEFYAYKHWIESGNKESTSEVKPLLSKSLSLVQLSKIKILKCKINIRIIFIFKSLKYKTYSKLIMNRFDF